MNKTFKWFLIGFGIILIVGIGSFQIMKHQTKKHSPEQTVSFKESGYDIKINYCRPFKKDREIFGGLVPFGEVWRTGANEPTSFRTATDLRIQGQTLPAGEYTMWTIPNDGEWQIIFNSGHPGWGVGLDEKASREPDLDIVNASVKTENNPEIIEQFTIDLIGNPPHLVLAWDDIQTDLALNNKN